MNEARRKKLQSDYTGNIEIKPGQFVQIDHVEVQPQPFGAYVGIGEKISEINEVLIEFGREPIRSPQDLKAMTVLVVDPGQYTLDWLVMTSSGPITKVSHAVGNAGRHRVVRDVHKLVQQKMGRPIGASFFSQIDQAMRDKKPLRIGGSTFDFQSKEFLTVVEKSIEDPLRQLFEGLRGVEDRIDLCVVMGGSPDDIANAIRKERSWLPVYCAKTNNGQGSSIYGNLIGFQKWAERTDRRLSNG